jgi:hypothetical protein
VSNEQILYWHLGALAVATIGHLAVTIAVLAWMYKAIRKMHNEAWVVLQVVKDWAQVARVQSKEAAIAVRAVTASEAMPPSRAQIVDTLRAMPEATAEKVIEKLHQGDSGIDITGV